MALLDAGAGIIVTAAPGTGSTALGQALALHRDVVEVPTQAAARTAGVDAKHATVSQLVAVGLVDANHGLRVVTTTRNPFDYYVAEYERTRTRWVHELRRPDSWVHSTPGAVDGIVDAVTMDFAGWLTQVVGTGGEPRRINAGHVGEADVVLRMEHVEDDLRQFLSLDVRVHRTNVTDRDRAYWQWYDVASRCLVARVHAEDLDRFGYVF